MTRITEPLREEHAELLPRLETIRMAADKVGDATSAGLTPLLDAALAFLRQELIPHAKAEEAVLYPAVARLLGAREATDTMSLDHEEVARLTDRLTELRAEAIAKGLTHQHQNDLRLVLYGLYALVRIHFRKEEEAYLPLLDARLGETEARQLFEAMEQSAGKIKAAL